MTVIEEERIVAEVRVDHSTLRGEVSGTNTRFTVGLAGRLDDRWIEAYRIVQGESTAYRRFRLDPSSQTISFSCRTVDGAVQVFETLDQLEAFLNVINQQA